MNKPPAKHYMSELVTAAKASNPYPHEESRTVHLKVKLEEAGRYKFVIRGNLCNEDQWFEQEVALRVVLSESKDILKAVTYVVHPANSEEADISFECPIDKEDTVVGLQLIGERSPDIVANSLSLLVVKAKDNPLEGTVYDWVEESTPHPDYKQHVLEIEGFRPVAIIYDWSPNQWAVYDRALNLISGNAASFEQSKDAAEKALIARYMEDVK